MRRRVGLYSYDYTSADELIKAIDKILSNDKNKNVNIQYQTSTPNNIMMHSALVTWEEEE